MTRPKIEPTKEQDLDALAVITAETELFPPEYLPDLVPPRLRARRARSG